MLHFLLQKYHNSKQQVTDRDEEKKTTVLAAATFLIKTKAKKRTRKKWNEQKVPPKICFGYFNTTETQIFLCPIVVVKNLTKSKLLLEKRVKIFSRGS